MLKFYFVKHYFSPLNTSMEKGKHLEPDPDPYLRLVDPDPGGPKTCGSCGSGSPALQNSRNQGVSNIFCLLVERYGTVQTNDGSGSGGPKNIRIRINNTGCEQYVNSRLFLLLKTAIVLPAYLPRIYFQDRDYNCTNTINCVPGVVKTFILF